jgi:hypothetical protein
MKSKECKDLMDKFIQEKPEIWYAANSKFLILYMLNHNLEYRNEDIGEEERVHSKESK